MSGSDIGSLMAALNPDQLRRAMMGQQQQPQQAQAQTEAPQFQVLPGQLHLNPNIAPQVPQGAPRPLGPGEFLQNPNGSWSNELSVTVPAGDQFTVLPSLWVVDGKPVRVSEDLASIYAELSGLEFQKFNTQEEAEMFAQQREANWQAMDPNASRRVKPLYTNGPQPQSDVTPEGRKLLDRIAAGESRGDYSVLYGGGHFSGSQFPEWSGRAGPAGPSHAAGKYQFEPGTWRSVSQSLGLTDFSPESQEKGAWYLAQSDYRARTGRDLVQDLKDPNRQQQIFQALTPTWTSLRGGVQRISAGSGGTPMKDAQDYYFPQKGWSERLPGTSDPGDQGMEKKPPQGAAPAVLDFVPRSDDPRDPQGT